MSLLWNVFRMFMPKLFLSAVGSYDVDAITASTHAKIEKKFRDNLSTKTPFFFKLTEQGGKDVIDGGKELTYPVIVRGGNAGSYYGDDVLTIDKPGGLQPLKYDWKQFYSTVRIDGIEEVMNTGEGLGASVMDGRMAQAEITTAEDFEEMLCGDGTGNSSKDWEGLQNLVSTTPTTGTIGGLSRSGYPQLQSQLNSDGTSGFTASQAGRTIMTKLYVACQNGLRSPNFVITTELIWTLYQLTLTTNERFIMNDKDKGLTSAGFQNTAFMRAPVVASEQAPADNMYMVRIAPPRSTGGMFLVLSRQRNFKMEPFIKPVNQDIRVAKILTAGNLCTDAPYLHGVATSITG